MRAGLKYMYMYIMIYVRIKGVAITVIYKIVIQMNDIYNTIYDMPLR